MGLENGKKHRIALKYWERQTINERAESILKNMVDWELPVFLMGATLVRVYIRGEYGVVQEMDLDKVRSMADACTECLRQHTDKKSEIPVIEVINPGNLELRTILAAWTYPDYIKDLKGIKRHVFFDGDGNLVGNNGYNEATGYWVKINESTQEALRGLKRTGQPDTAKNVETVFDLLEDFPFEGSAAKTMAVATMLTFICRPMIRGGVPITMIKAAVQDTGKSTLARVMLYSMLGRRAKNQGFSFRDEAEVEKKLITYLFEGADCVWIDNIDQHISSGSISTAVDNGTFVGRLLGSNKQVVVDSSMPFIMTANNPDASRDILARSVNINLVQTQADMGRRVFAHKNPEEYALERSPEVICALVGMVWAWQDAGSPRFTKRGHTKYSDWSEIIGGILECAGFEDFLEDLEKYRKEGDRRDYIFQLFITEWASQFYESEVSSKDLLELAGGLELVNKDDPEGKQTQKLGMLLGRNAGRVFSVELSGGYDRDVRLERKEGAHHLINWMLKAVEGEEKT
jgi:hypothetical protein